MRWPIPTWNWQAAGARHHATLSGSEIDPHSRIEVTITLKGPDLPALDKLPDRPLSRSEIDREWGIPPETIQKAERVLRSFGLHVQAVRQGGRSLRVAGSAAAMMAAFHPKLGVYQVPGQGEIRGREGPLMVPRELDGLITGVDGLDQRRMARRHAAGAPARGLKPLAPADLEQ